MGDELKSLTLADLHALAKQKGIKGISKLNKEELIDLIIKAHREEKTLEVKNTEKAEEIVKEDVKEESSNEKVEQTKKQVNVQEEKPQFTDESVPVEGVLEVLPDGFGFLRGQNYLSTPKDIYVSPVQIKRFRLDSGDKIKGYSKVPKEGEKFQALIYVSSINGDTPDIAMKRKKSKHMI